MSSRLLMGKRTEFGFSSFVDVAVNALAAMSVFLVVYVAVVPPSPPPPPLRILTRQLPPAVWFQPYEAGIHVSGGVGWYQFQIQPLEQLEALGLQVDPSQGRMGGVPKPSGSQPGTSSRTIPLKITVRDADNAEVQVPLELRILPVAIPFDPQKQPLRLVQNNTDLREAWLGHPYTEDIAILGGIEPYDVHCEGLPPGLRWQEGRIEGKPLPEAIPEGNSFQEYKIRLFVRDQQTRLPSWASQPEPQVAGNFRLMVRRPVPLELEGLYPSTARAGVAYEGFLVFRGGSGRFRIDKIHSPELKLEAVAQQDQITLGDLGLHVDCRTGKVTGIPKVPSTEPPTAQRFSFILSAQDDLPFLPEVEAKFSLTVLPPMQFVKGEEKK